VNTDHTDSRIVLNLTCPDRVGIVGTVGTFLASSGLNILECQQHVDLVDQRLFMRIEAGSRAEAGGTDIDELRAGFTDLAISLGMEWAIHSVARPGRVLIMVSQLGHCLNDLLYRTSIGALNADIVGVVSNHQKLGPLAHHYGVPFHHVPVTAGNKADAEASLLKIVDETDTDLVVLARYMQIISPDLCSKLQDRLINIHHSFLPSFKGARPYLQAHNRGVKVIGATAHYVTEDLDEGPIIEQEVQRVDHRAAPEHLEAIGRDVETVCLARAVEWHLEHRVMRNGHRTVVFR